MFTVSKQELVEGLIKIQHRLCAYGTTHGDGRPCDCKFGAESVANLGHESTGCPEVRQVLKALGAPFRTHKPKGK